MQKEKAETVGKKRIWINIKKAKILGTEENKKKRWIK